MIDSQDDDAKYLPVPPAHPPGPWQRAGSYPAPLTPFDAAWLLPAHNRASKATFTDLSAMLDHIELRLISGYVYRQVVYFGSQRESAAPKMLSRALFRLRPAMAARLAGALRTTEQHFPEAIVDRWESEWKPRLTSVLDAAGESDTSAISDADLDAHADRLVRMSLDAYSSGMQVLAASAILLGRFERSCRVSLAYDGDKVKALLTVANSGTGGDQSYIVAAARAALPDTARSGFDEQLNSAIGARDAIEDARSLALNAPLIAGRQIAREFGRRLVGRQLLAEPGDACFFSMEELRVSLRAGLNVMSQAFSQRAVYAVAGERPVVPIFGERPTPPPLDLYPNEVRRMTEALLDHLDLLSGGMDCT